VSHAASLRPDLTEEGVEVGRDTLLEAIQSMALLVGERGVGGDGSEETGNRRSVSGKWNTLPGLRD